MSGPGVAEIHCGRVLVAQDAIRARPTRIVIDGEAIAGLEPSGDARAARLLAMPALANAHDHGRGLRPLCYGAVDQPLETWFSALNVHPAIDPYVNAAVAFSRMARGGIGSVVHCHMARSASTLVNDAIAVCRAAEDVGVRLAFVVPMRDRGRLGYFPDDWVLARLPKAHRAAIEKRWLGAVLPLDEQLALVDEIAGECESELVTVQYGPAAPHWCTQRMLERVAEASARSGRRVHMHCLETVYQREFADAVFPHGLFAYLRAIGLLSPRLTLAHGVYLRPDEMDAIAAAGATVSINCSSNLRLRSGIAPAGEMAARGVRIAMGIDALGLDDTEDGLRELRLTHLLNAGVGFGNGLPIARLLQGALEHGARAVDGGEGHGRIAPGAPADIAVLDFTEMARDVMPGVVPDIDVLLARATGRHLRTLVVAGREVVRDGNACGVDAPGLERELAAQALAAAPAYRDAQPLLEALQSTLRDCYASGLHTHLIESARHAA